MSTSGTSRHTILFVVEAITLSQLVRLRQLAAGLAPEAWEVHFASAKFPALVFSGTRFVQHHIDSIPMELAMKKTAQGRRLYNRKRLSHYVSQEMALMRSHQT